MGAFPFFDDPDEEECTTCCCVEVAAGRADELDELAKAPLLAVFAPVLDVRPKKFTMKHAC